MGSSWSGLCDRKNWEMSQRKDQKVMEGSHRVKEGKMKESKCSALGMENQRTVSSSTVQRALGAPTGAQWWGCPTASLPNGREAPVLVP